MYGVRASQLVLAATFNLEGCVREIAFIDDVVALKNRAFLRP